MIEEKTVLVLGAGSSKHCDYPLGYDLVNNMCKLLQRHPASNQINQQVKVLQELGFEPEKVYEFRDALSNCGMDTIDEFLMRNRDLDRIGKHAIAMAISHCENQSWLMEGDKSSNWYKYLFRAMVNDQLEIEAILKNEISFITFNYDRSLEQFLFTSLNNTFRGIPKQKIFDIMSKVPIIHVHGQIGFMPWQSKNFRNYSPALDCDNLKKAAEGIITINETGEGTEGFVRARQLITNSKKVIFLGFGFHPDNIKMLNATMCLRRKDTCNCFRYP